MTEAVENGSVAVAALEQRVAALESAEKRKANWPWGVAAVITAVAAFLPLILLGVYLYGPSVLSKEPPGSTPEVFLSTLATMLAILVAGAFIFTTFRIDAQAEQVAIQAVQPAVAAANEAAKRALDAEKKLLEIIDEASKSQLFAEGDAFASLRVAQPASPPSDANGAS